MNTLKTSSEITYPPQEEQIHLPEDLPEDEVSPPYEVTKPKAPPPPEDSTGGTGMLLAKIGRGDPFQGEWLVSLAP